MVIYCHSIVITKVMLLYNTEWQYDHGMAVNYCSKTFYDIWPRCQFHQYFMSSFFVQKFFCTCFMCLQCRLVIFWWKDLGAKAAHKMLVKLTPGIDQIEIFVLSALLIWAEQRIFFHAIHILNYTGLIFSFQDKNGQDYQTGMALNGFITLSYCLCII